MSTSTLFDWQAFDVLEPIGGSGDDFRLAYALATLVQVQTGGKWVGPPQPRDHNRAPFTAADFLLLRGSAPQQKRRVGLAAVHPGADVDPARAAKELDAFFQQAGWGWTEE